MTIQHQDLVAATPQIMSASQTLKPIADAVATSTEDAPVVATSQGDEQAMARYRQTKSTFMRPHPNSRPALLKPGATVLLAADAEPGFNLEPLDAAARAAFRRIFENENPAALLAGAMKTGNHKLAARIKRLVALSKDEM